MTTVLEALQTAQRNFTTLGNMGVKNNLIYRIAMDQLANAITALENGHPADFVIQARRNDATTKKDKA